METAWRQDAENQKPKGGFEWRSKEEVVAWGKMGPRRNGRRKGGVLEQDV